jgi:hypothetical protein
MADRWRTDWSRLRLVRAGACDPRADCTDCTDCTDCVQERATHGRAMRLARQQASADLQMARDAWAHERRVGGNLARGRRLGRRRRVVGLADVHPAEHAAAHAENGRLHAAEWQAARHRRGLAAPLRERSHGVACTCRGSQGARGDVRRTAGEHAAVSPLGGDAPAPLTQPGPAAVKARQLVNAKLAEADLRRKQRVASRSKVALRDEIVSRDARIRELRSGGELLLEASSDLAAARPVARAAARAARPRQRRG